MSSEYEPVEFDDYEDEEEEEEEEIEDEDEEEEEEEDDEEDENEHDNAAEADRGELAAAPGKPKQKLPPRKKKKAKPVPVDTHHTGDLDSMGLYLRDTHRHGLLTKADEQQYSRAMRAALADIATTDEPGVDRLNEFYENRTRMIEGNLRLVISIAKHYRHLGLPLQDLIPTVARVLAAEGNAPLNEFPACLVQPRLPRVAASQPGHESPDLGVHLALGLLGHRRSFPPLATRGSAQPVESPPFKPSRPGAA